MAEDISAEDWQLIKCPKCKSLFRPHVLWFDEYYNEKWFHYQSSSKIARKTDILVIVGTSGATNLPNQIVNQVILKRGIIIDINIEKNYFSELAESYENGYYIKGKSSEILPGLFDEVKIIIP